jgi:hypothetical protein
MISRPRGEHDTAYLHPWRPKRAGTAPHPSSRDTPDASTPPDQAATPRARRVNGRRRRPVLSALLAMTLVAAGYWTHGWLDPGAARDTSPTTPRAWFDAYMASAVDDPARACRTLLSPELAAVYATKSPHGCIGYFRTVVDTPVVIETVRRSGDSAVVQLRQRHPPRRWSSIVLRRHSGVWQATALRRGR